MTGSGENEWTRKQQLFRTLRREILDARVKVMLDERLGRETSPEVRTLAGMKLPSIAKLNRADEETDLTTSGQTRKQQLFRTLRREIRTARLKVTLDEQLGRETSPAVRILAGIKLPPIVKVSVRDGGVTEQGDHDPASKDEVFRRLRREIRTARLKVTLDEQRGRKTSPTVRMLAEMKLPVI